MSMSVRGRTILLVVFAFVLGSVAFAGPTAADEAASYGGRAKVVDARILNNRHTVSDTGELDESGGFREASAMKNETAGIITTRLLHATTVGAGEASRSEASLARLDINASGHRIQARFVMARSSATCSGSLERLEGTSEIAGLRIDGEDVSVSDDPNDTIYLPRSLGKIVINEQGLNEDSIFVNALHIQIATSVDIIVGSATSSITCSQLPQPEDPDLPIPCIDRDFITGGGWTTGTPSGSKANFSVAGGVDDGRLTGHLNYHEHGSKMKVKGTSVTRYVIVDENTRHIEGTADIDGYSGTYLIDVSDNGEPGRNDTFSMRLSNGYSVSGYIGGGNIQLHGNCDDDD